MEKQSLVLLSSEVMISEESKLHPVFLTARFLLASTEGNLNNESVTKSFIDDLVARQSTFDCLPMYVDMPKLLAGDYDNLTHLYNRVTKKFKTQQFGSLTNFSAETDENGVTALYADARFPKRELEACMRIVELYELGKLCVSVELRYNPEHTIEKDGVMYIDAHEDNALTGLCIVSQPAERRAIALDLVAEKNADNSPKIITDGEEPTNRGETDTMEKENITAEVTEEVVNKETQETVETVAEVVEETQEEVVTEEQTAVAEEQTEQVEETVAETEETTAEVLEHSVDTHESVEVCPYSGEPVHVIEYHERIIETLEDAGNLIAELDNKIAELEEIKSKYDAIVAEQQKIELAEKQAKARAFAEKQGLDTSAEAVVAAVDALDYQAIAELTMAQAQEEEPAKEEQPAITLASFVELDISEDKYGGLLSRRNK